MEDETSDQLFPQESDLHGFTEFYESAMPLDIVRSEFDLDIFSEVIQFA